MGQDQYEQAKKGKDPMKAALRYANHQADSLLKGNLAEPKI